MLQKYKAKWDKLNKKGKIIAVVVAIVAVYLIIEAI
jgi:flagellar biosynthesis/type III secretory pathway M-ring protein FliF/YscJ|tara:strand:- start:1516 stop:1623 length:108 start_codon:yes stop_codon:yes gene_type:complete